MPVPFRILSAISTAIDSVEITFNHNVNSNLTEQNFTIYQAYGLGELKILSISVKDRYPNIIVLKTYTQIPFMVYKIVMNGVRASDTNELVDTNYSHNTVLFDGYSERDEILDRMVDSLSPIISRKTKRNTNGIEVETNVSKLLRPVAAEVKELQEEVENVAADNYLSILIENEKLVRGKGHYDKLSRYGAFEITRVSKEPTTRALKYNDTSRIYFDGDVQLITQSLVGSLTDDRIETDNYGNLPSGYTYYRYLSYDDPALVNAGRFLRKEKDYKYISVYGAESAFLTSTPYKLRLNNGPILKILFVINVTTQTVYPLTSYALKRNFYDANNAFIDDTLADNEFRLNPSVGGFAPPAAGDEVQVVYTYNNSTRKIIEDSLSVTATVSIPASRRPGDAIPDNYYAGVNINTEDIGDTTSEPSYGPSYLEEARLQGLYYKLAHSNILDSDGTSSAGSGASSLALFTVNTWFDGYGDAQGVTVTRVDGVSTLWEYNGNKYNLNPFQEEIQWDPSLSGRIPWGQYMVNYSTRDSITSEVQIEYGVPVIDNKTVPAEVARKRLLSIPSSIYVSYIYTENYSNNIDYSVILDSKNIYSIDPLMIGAITPINSASSNLSSSQWVNVSYTYENVFVQNRDYSLFANVEECYEKVEGRVSVDDDGNTFINTRKYPIESVNSVFSEGTGIKYPIVDIQDNYVQIDGDIDIKSVTEALDLKTVTQTVDITSAGKSITLPGTLILNDDHSRLGGDVYVSIPYEDSIKSIAGNGLTALITTSHIHHLHTGQLITVHGSKNYDAQYEVASILNNKSFTVASDVTTTELCDTCDTYTGYDTYGGIYYSIDKLKLDKLAIRTAYLAGTDTNLQNLVQNSYESGNDQLRLSGMGVDSLRHTFEVTPITIGDAYYKTNHPESIVLFNTDGPCNNATSDIDSLASIKGCFAGSIDSSVEFENTVCVYDGGGFCLLTAGIPINTDNASRQEVIDSEHLNASTLLSGAGDPNLPSVYTTSGKTSPNYNDTPSVCSDSSNVDPNLYNLYAPCKSTSCCAYTPMFHKEVPFIDGETEFYAKKVDLNNVPILDDFGNNVLVRREPYGAYSIDYASGVVYLSIDPASVAANTQKQVRVNYGIAAADTKNPYITRLDKVEQRRTTKVSGANAQIDVIEALSIDRVEGGTIYFSDTCMHDGSVHKSSVGTLNNIYVNVTGSGYTSEPNVEISGGGGTGATVHAVLLDGSVTSIVIDSQGEGFTSIPTVMIDPPGGNGVPARAVASIAAKGSTASRCLNYPYALSDVSEQFQGKYTPTGCIYDQSTTGYSVCAKMDGEITSTKTSPSTEDPDYIYRLSATSKIHGICLETSCRFYTPSGKQQNFVGHNGRGLYYPNCKNSLCPNYQPICLGLNDKLYADYSYVADSLIVDYVYGDNAIDWSPNMSALKQPGMNYLNVDNDGDEYYVSYKIGAREPALYDNFAYVLGSTALNASSRRWAKETYRKAILGVIAAYLSGPTFLGVSELVEIFTQTPPEIIEANTFGWTLGKNYVYTVPPRLTGNETYSAAMAVSSDEDQSDVGLVMKNDNVLRYDGETNFKIASGSLDLFMAPEWEQQSDAAIIDLNQNNSQALRGRDIIDNALIYSGITYDDSNGYVLISDSGVLDYVIDAGNIVSWKSLEIDNMMLPSFVDEAEKVTIDLEVRAWSDDGYDIYSDQSSNCGMYGFAYDDEYAPDYNKKETIEFKTITGTNGYTCPDKEMPSCAVDCINGCPELICDCLEHCQETLFVDLDNEIANNATDHIGKYLTFITGSDRGRSYVISDVTIQTIAQMEIKTITATEPDTNPKIGDRHIIPESVDKTTSSGAENEWYGQKNNIAVWNGKEWEFISPITGQTVWVLESSYQYKWNGDNWVMATVEDVNTPGMQSSKTKIGFVLSGYLSTSRENEIVYRISYTPKIPFLLDDVPTSRYLRISLNFTLDKTACDPYSYGYNYGAYPIPYGYDEVLTCGTRLAISNIEAFYTSPVCAQKSSVISTLLDISADKDGDMFSNRISIFRDISNELHFRVYEAKEYAKRHLQEIEGYGEVTTWPDYNKCRSFYEVVVDLDKVYGSNALATDAHPCGLSADSSDVGSAEWTTKRRHYFGFSWKLNDGLSSCAAMDSNLHVFIDGNEYPKEDDALTDGSEYKAIGWVNHGVLCPDGTLYQDEVREARNGLDHWKQVDFISKRGGFNKIELCKVPSVEPAFIDFYLNGWFEDTTKQWASYGVYNTISQPINIDYTENMLKLYSTDKSSKWPCNFVAVNTLPSADNADTRTPAGIYVSKVYDGLISKNEQSGIPSLHWSSVKVVASSTTLQRKMYSRASLGCGEVLDYCDVYGYDNSNDIYGYDCYSAGGSTEFAVIDVGSPISSVWSGIKIFYRTSEYSNFIENGVIVPWKIVDYDTDINGIEYGYYNYYGGGYGTGVIPPCTDKFTCSSDIDADGRYIQYRIELFTDGSFSPIIYSIDFGCNKRLISDYLSLPSISGKNLYITPINSGNSYTT